MVSLIGVRSTPKRGHSSSLQRRWELSRTLSWSIPSVRYICAFKFVLYGALIIASPRCYDISGFANADASQWHHTRHEEADPAFSC
jgi:hypothetical protein